MCSFLRPGLESIPHRDTIRERVTVEWEGAFIKLREELAVGHFPNLGGKVVLTRNCKQHSCGKISFTADIWSSATLMPYLAVTSHWIAREDNLLVLKAALIGFHRLTKAHTGKNVAAAILAILDRASITSKVSDLLLKSRTLLT
jgi:hypothetical protein